jgi:signal peptidase II
MNNDLKVEQQDDNLQDTGENPATISEKAILFLVMALVLLVDYLSKIVIENSMQLNTSWAPIPALASIFRITHVKNIGAAFGLFPSGSTLFMLVALAVSAFIVIYNSRLPGNHYLYRVALGLQLGGALGNLISRVRLGHVTDFFDFGPWPVFNVADLAIVSGVFLLAFLMFKEQRQERQEKHGEQAESTALDTDQT